MEVLVYIGLVLLAMGEGFILGASWMEARIINEQRERAEPKENQNG